MLKHEKIIVHSAVIFGNVFLNSIILVVAYIYKLDMLFCHWTIINSKQYFLRNLGVMLLWFSVALIIVISTVCIIYNDFSLFGVMFIYFENAIIYIILMASLLAFMFKNILVSYCMNILLWISSIVILAIFPNQHYIAYFDASNIVYLNLEKYLGTNNSSYLALWQSSLYNLVVFAIIFGLVCIFSKRWVKNGI